MTDVDPYVGPPAEPAPRRRLARLAPWLTAAILLLLLAAWWLTQVAQDREDPTLQIPSEALQDDGLQDDGLIPAVPGE